MKVKVTSGASAIGVPVLSKTFENILNSMPQTQAEFVPPERLMGTNWNDVDLIWNIGFFFEVDCFFDWIKAYYPQVKIVNTWVGTDILNTAQWLQARGKCYHCALRSIDIHVADGVNLQEELRQMLSLESYYVPSVPDPLPLTPLRSTSTVAVYLPAHRKDFYNGEVIVEVAKRNPHLQFDFYSITPDPDLPHLPNCHFRGFLSGKEKFEAFTDASTLIMLPQHGSVSLMLMEFMMMGRRVVSTVKAPYVYTVEEPVTAGIVEAQLLQAIRDSVVKGVYKEAGEHYHREYGFDKVKTYINPVFEKVREMA